MAFPVPQHDHLICIHGALEAAEAACRQKGARLTEIRRRVLELVWESHQPVGAYALLETLAREGRSAAPPTVYRALEFLQRHGLVHRIALLNAFTGCSRPGHPHAGKFLLCAGCGMAAELEDEDIDRAVNEAADRLGFTVSRQTIEVEGVCPSCRGREAVR
ncbi:MAG: Fur family transcriptional regulator [Phaeospirillum sp.]|nr:Fur family transcriptional regulator [Phaeospirillum sp.]